MKKLTKRSYTEREKTFALASCTCVCGCTCTGAVCSCPIAPTHQIGLNQETQRKTSASISADASYAGNNVVAERIS